MYDDGTSSLHGDYDGQKSLMTNRMVMDSLSMKALTEADQAELASLHHNFSTLNTQHSGMAPTMNGSVATATTMPMTAAPLIPPHATTFSQQMQPQPQQGAPLGVVQPPPRPQSQPQVPHHRSQQLLSQQMQHPSQPSLAMSLPLSTGVPAAPVQPLRSQTPIVPQPQPSPAASRRQPPPPSENEPLQPLGLPRTQGKLVAGRMSASGPTSNGPLTRQGNQSSGRKDFPSTAV